jgi:hypothetical protein
MAYAESAIVEFLEPFKNQNWVSHIAVGEDANHNQQEKKLTECFLETYFIIKLSFPTNP